MSDLTYRRGMRFFVPENGEKATLFGVRFAPTYEVLTVLCDKAILTTTFLDRQLVPLCSGCDTPAEQCTPEKKCCHACEHVTENAR